MIGKEDKRGCTILVTTCADGSVLPFQMIFGGKTEASLPKTDLRHTAELEGHDFTMSESHWCTVVTLKRWVEKVLYPAYVERCRNAQLDVGKQECILQFDLYKVSFTFCTCSFPSSIIHALSVLVGAHCGGVPFVVEGDLPVH